ncbi:porin family protein [Aridibaculum aurantiacum]|uniref:porin family protein n=1 Tax=Aridibaculum aurantiacum TaxID=2810307 RepID=UPI001A96429A|nr:porin family protein [Aridibaculum aurantiacum]
MKKYLLAAVLGVCAVTANAQSRSRFSLGPNAGVGSTWIDNVQNKKFKTHGNVGLSMVFSAHPNFGIGTDVKYSFEGGRTDNALPNNSVGIHEISLDYLRVPIKAIYFFGKPGHRLRPKLSAGPSLGFLMGGKTTYSVRNQSGVVSPISSARSKDVWNSFDIGLQGAGGIHYRLVQSTWLVADVTYYHGLRDIVDNNNTNVQHKNRNLGLNLGVNFGL